MQIVRYMHPSSSLLKQWKVATTNLFRRRRARLLKKLVSPAEANSVLTRLVRGPDPAFVGRLGGTECSVCWRYLKRSALGLGFELPYKDKLAKNASLGAGINPADGASLDRFASIYIGAIPSLDMIGLWDVRGMYELVDRLGNPGLVHTHLTALEPWDALFNGHVPWTQALEGQSVLVVHPFAESITMQYGRRREIKTISEILPDFQLATLVPPVTFAGCGNGKSWVRNYEETCSRIADCRFDVALLGCGAYGFPLGAFVKKMGRKAIHLGGATQLLFGIRGKRWEAYEKCSVLMDSTWVRPLPSETPARAQLVEDGCYW